MNAKLAAGAVILALAFGTTTVRADEDDSYTSYDSIINELKASAEDHPARPQEPDLNWDEVALHVGMALTTSYVNMSAPNGARGAGLLKGFEANVGANLFTQKARAEVLFRNYAPESLSREMNADLTELEARVVLLPKLENQFTLRMGFGLGVRYMDISAFKNGREDGFSSSNPATSILLGVERKVSKAVSIGPDVAYRSTLSATSFDKSAWDAAIRLNATF